MRAGARTIAPGLSAARALRESRGRGHGRVGVRSLSVSAARRMDPPLAGLKVVDLTRVSALGAAQHD